MEIIKNRSNAFLFLPAMVFAMSWVVGCAPPTGDQLLAEPSSAESKKVAVVSLLGDVFHASYIGASIFSKQRYYSNIPQWGVDEYAEDIVAGLIRRTDQHQLVSFNPKRESFTRVYKQPSHWRPQARNYEVQKIAPALTALHEKYGVDTLLLVLHNEIKDPTNKGSHLRLSGYGLYHNDWLGAHTFTHLFARLLVVDARNASVIATADLSDFTQVDNQLWHQGLGQTPPEDRERLKQDIRVLLKSNLMTALVETGFASPDELRTAKKEVLAGSAYSEAVEDLYSIFNMQRLFASYTQMFVDNKLTYNTGSELYADVYRRWLQTYFRQAQVVAVLHKLYQAQAYTLDELQSIAVLAKNKRTRKGINEEQVIQSVARQAWGQLATPSNLNGLLRAVQKRRTLIRQEARRSLSL